MSGQLVAHACQPTRVCEWDLSVVCRTPVRSSCWSGDGNAGPVSVGSVS